jgi:hypothetical protein
MSQVGAPVESMTSQHSGTRRSQSPLVRLTLRPAASSSAWEVAKPDNPVLGLHISGNGVNQALTTGLDAES